MQFHSECGLELLSRLNEKSYSINLDESLFPNRIDNRSIVEIVGASSTGKSLLLYQLIAKCILPVHYKGIKIDGCDTSAILIDTLNHVQSSKIAEIMTSATRNACESADKKLPVETLDLVVSNALKNLTVISCCNNDQLKLTLHTLEDELLRDEKIGLLAVDDISTYYWQERKEREATISIDQYVKSLIDIVQAQTSQFRAATIYTRWQVAMSKHESDTKHGNLSKGTSTNYRLQLCQNATTREFTCHVQSTNNTRRQIRYTISNSGIKWIH